jgi:hypothetical protein
MDTIIKPTLDEKARDVVVNPRPSSDFYATCVSSEIFVERGGCPPVLARLNGPSAAQLQEFHRLLAAGELVSPIPVGVKSNTAARSSKQ